MKELEYPFDPGYIMKKRRSIKKELLKTDKPFIEKRIAVLGGSTTHDIIDILELFLLNYGIRPTFYESEHPECLDFLITERTAVGSVRISVFVFESEYRTV